jgi:hypothetical protein
MMAEFCGASRTAWPGYLAPAGRLPALLRGCDADGRAAMASIPGNPLGYARDIAEGNAPFTAIQLKRMTEEELRKVFANINIVLREVRTTAVADRDIDGMRRRAHKLQRLNTALMLLENHAKRLHIHL